MIGRRGLDRFREAQDRVWLRVLAELALGRKETHWMWFVFPQRKGLGRSSLSRYYALSPREARRYWDDPVLGMRLRVLTAIVGTWVKAGRPLEAIFGEVDAMKFRSCMELFGSVTSEPPFAGWSA